MWELWPVILAGAIVVYLLLRYRETFVIKYGNPLDDEDLISFDPEARGNFLLSVRMDDTCPPREARHKTEMDAGLCYEPCAAGYHGVGPICWADTFDIGPGQPVGLEPCPAGWVNDGLTCRKPITCEPIRCAKGLAFFTEGCSGGGCSGGQVVGRLDKGGICDWPEDRGNLPSWLVDKSDPRNYKATHPDRIDGMCYAKCPKDKPDHVPGMPYLCYKNTRGFSYSRGVGDMPPLFRFGNK